MMSGGRIILMGLAGALAGGCALAQTAISQGSVAIVDPPQFGKQTELTAAPLTLPHGAQLVAVQIAPARYAIAGRAGDTFNIVVPSSLRLVRSGGTDEIQLTLTPSRSVTTLGGRLGSPSSAEFGITGKVGVNGATAAGLYEGAFDVIMALQ